MSLTEADKKELDRFNDVELSATQGADIRYIKDACRDYVAKLLAVCPASADRSAAVRSARLASMQAVASICFDSAVS